MVGLRGRGRHFELRSFQQKSSRLESGESREGKNWKHQRDFASVQELIVMANLESFNSRMVKEKIPRELRLQKLREQAVSELISLAKIKNIPDNKNNLFSKIGLTETEKLIKPKPKNLDFRGTLSRKF